MFTNEQVAQVCHAANRELQIIQGDPVVSPPWADAPAWQRESAIRGVEAAIGDVTGMLAGKEPEDLHESWMADKIADGWAYGPVKDPDLKTHPCLVPYEDLPAEQKAKDALFLVIVGALALNV